MSENQQSDETAATVVGETQVVVEVAAKLTPEQEEEIKLRSKYPNPNRPPCGSALVQKLLHKGSKKYFDSGDYNMARSKIKASNQNKLAGGVANIPPPPTTTTTTVVSNNVAPTAAEDEPKTTTESPVDPVININEPPSTHFATTPQLTATNVSRLQHPHTPNIVVVESVTSEEKGNEQNMPPSTPLLQTHQHFHHSAASASTSPSTTATPSASTGPSLSSSVSTSSIHHHQLMNNLSLSGSLSTDKLSNIQLNPVVDSGFAHMVTLDGDEIGHGIPTPECLPQSRKHSIAQSKLATPRLSSS